MLPFGQRSQNAALYPQPLLQLRSHSHPGILGMQQAVGTPIALPPQSPIAAFAPQMYAQPITAPPTPQGHTHFGFTAGQHQLPVANHTPPPCAQRVAPHLGMHPKPGGTLGFVQQPIPAPSRPEHSWFRQQIGMQAQPAMHQCQQEDVRKCEEAGFEVVLHVYNLQHFKRFRFANALLQPLGTGVYHTAVEVCGREFSFGSRDEGTGVMEADPGTDEKHRYRQAISMGRTNFSQAEILEIIYRLKEEWQGEDYDMLRQNCQHFAMTLCRELGVAEVPRWIVRLPAALARLDDIRQPSKQKAREVRDFVSSVGVSRQVASGGA